jgi:hypothetical protein
MARKKKKEDLIIGKPKVKLPKYSAKKALLSGGDRKLVSEGRTGYFDKEMVEERKKWLS